MNFNMAIRTASIMEWGDMKKRNPRLLGTFFCLFPLFAQNSHSALENGGAKIYPALYANSVSETVSTGGALTLKALSAGGLTDSAAAMSGGNFTMNYGGAAQIVVIDSSRSDLSSAHCYPVPFRPSQGHTKIRFTGLTGTAKIFIYTLSGEAVKTLYKSGTDDFIDWDARNEKGENVFSGVYLYAIKSASEKKTGKLMIIR